MNEPTVIRQGDVTLVRVSGLPVGATRLARSGRLIVQDGEATGHAHAIVERGVDLYGDGLDARFLAVLAEGGVSLVHEEHDTLTVPAGVYEVRIGRVWSPAGTRRVTD